MHHRASTLSASQKALSVLLSIILVVGLSPFGQNPQRAYAADGDTAQAAQTGATATAATASKSTLTGYEVQSGGVTFKAEDFFKKNDGAVAVDDEWTAEAAFATDKLLTLDEDSAFAIYKAPKTDKEAAVVFKATAGEGEVEFSRCFTKYAYYKKGGYDAGEDALTEIYDQGDYELVLWGTGSQRRSVLVAPFTVKPFDISAKATTVGGTVKDIAYMGKNVAIEFDGNGATISGTDAADKTTTLNSVAFAQGTDFDFEKPSVKEMGPHNDIKIVGKGNYTGSKATRVTVTQGYLATAGNLMVNGALNSASDDDDEDYVDTIDLAAAKKNPTDANPDPVDQGKVIFGEETLAKGTDYTVKYYDADDEPIEGNAAPTAIGRGYQAVITATGSSFVTTGGGANKTVTVTYDIVSATSLDDVAASVQFATTPFKMNSDEVKSADQVIRPASATFLAADGKTDVTAKVGDSWELVSAQAWTEDDEMDLLGESYSKVYPNSDSGYKNTAAASKIATAIEAEDFNVSDDTTVYGFNAYLPAGDYKVTVKAAGSLTSGTLTGKWTVAKAKPVEGASVGNIVITASKAGYNGGEAIAMTGENSPVLKQAAGSYAESKKKTKAVSTEALSEGTPLDVLTGKADYSVTYSLDGAEVDEVKDAGTYTATFTFGGPNFEAGTIVKEKALVVDTPELDSVANLAVVAAEDAKGKGINYMYTGHAVEPTLTLYKADADALEAVKDAQAAYDEASADEAETKLAALAAAIDAAIAGKTPVKGLKLNKDYTLSYTQAKGDYIAFDGGKAAGPGSYTVTARGAGDYVTTAGHEVPVYGSNYSENPQFTISPVNLTSETGYVAMQFSADGTDWTTEYSAALADAKAAAPKARLVTAATADKGKDATAIDPSIYEIAPFEVAKAGAVTVIAKATDESYAVSNTSFEGTFNVADSTFEAAKATLKLTDTQGRELPASAEFTGEAHDVVAKVFVGDTELVQQTAGSGKGVGSFVTTIKNAAGDVVYKSTMDDNKGVSAVGKYTVTVTGGQDGKYAGSLTADYEVTAKEIKANDSKLKIELGKLTFNGEEQDALKSITYDDAEFTLATDAKNARGAAYTVEGNKATDAGTHPMTITFCGDYTGTVEKTYKVAQGKLDDLAAAGKIFFMVGDKLLRDDDKVYEDLELGLDCYSTDFTGEAQKPEVTVYSADTNKPVKGLGYTHLYGQNKNAGEGAGTVTVVSDGGNYTGRVKCVFDIAGCEIGSDRLTINIDDDLTFTGKPVEPKGTLTYKLKNGTDYTMEYGADYTVEYLGDNTTAGSTAQAKFIGLAPNFEGGAGFVLKDFTVQENKRADQVITVGAGASVTRAVGSGAFNLNAKTTGDATLAYATSNGSVAAVDTYGNVTPAGQGTATITVSAPATDKFNAAEPVEVKVTVTPAVQPQTQAITASDVTVTVGKTAAIGAKASGNGLLTYSTSNPAVATVNSAGVVTGVAAGTAMITINASANGAYASASKVVVATVKAAAAPAKKANPITVKAKKVTAKAKALKSKKAAVKAAKYFKVSGAQGKVTYKLVSAKKGKKAVKCFKVGKKNGKLVIKKGTKKGAYKLSVSATAAGNASYGAKTVTKAVKVVVKK